MVSEVLGAASMIYVKDEDGLYTADLKSDSGRCYHIAADRRSGTCSHATCPT